MRIRGGCGSEALDLPFRVGRVGVRRRQLAHQPNHLDRRLEQLREPPAAHPDVELQMHAHTLGHVVRRHDQLEPRTRASPTSRLPAGAMTMMRAIGKSTRSASPSGTVATQSAVAPAPSDAPATSEAPCPYALALTVYAAAQNIT